MPFAFVGYNCQLNDLEFDAKTEMFIVNGYAGYPERMTNTADFANRVKAKVFLLQAGVRGSRGSTHHVHFNVNPFDFG